MPVKKMVSDSGKSQAGKNSAALEDETNNLNHDRLAVPDELPEVEEELSADPRPKGKLKIKKVEAPPTKFLPRNSAATPPVHETAGHREEGDHPAGKGSRKAPAEPATARPRTKQEKSRPARSHWIPRSSRAPRTTR